MLDRIIVLFIISAQLLWTDSRMLKKASQREIMAYAAVMLVTGYLAIMFIFEKNWPNYNDLLDFVFLAPAQKIVHYLKAPS